MAKTVRRHFTLSINIEFDRSVEDTEDALTEEMDEVQEVVSGAVNGHVPKAFRGSTRVTVVRSSMGPPA